MRILLWHGYLLGGTGSNVYTRALAREWSPRRARRDRPQPGAAPRGVRPRRSGRRPAPTSAGSCPSFVLDRYEGYDGAAAARLHARASSSGGSPRTPPPCASTCPRTSSSRNHVLLGGPVGAAAGAPYAVKAHGSELEYAMRGQRGALGVGRGGAGRRPRDVRRLASTSARVVAEVLRPHRARRRGAAGRRRRALAAGGARRALAALLGEARARRAEPGQRARSACPDEGNAERLEAFLAGERADGRLLRQADPAERRRRAPAVAARARRARGDRRLRAGARQRWRRWRARRASRRCSPVRSSTATSAHLLALADACVVALGLPGGVRDGRGGGGGAPAARRSSRATPAWPRSPSGWRRHLPPALARARQLSDRRRRRAARAPRDDCSRSGAADRETLRAGVRRAVEARWSWASVASQLAAIGAGSTGPRGAAP